MNRTDAQFNINIFHFCDSCNIFSANKANSLFCFFFLPKVTEKHTNTPLAKKKKRNAWSEI